MNTTTKVALSVTLIIGLVGAGMYANYYIARDRAVSEYGGLPPQVVFSRPWLEADGLSCVAVGKIFDNWYVDWLGRIGWEPVPRWADVVVTIRDGESMAILPHGHVGDVRLRQTVCGLPSTYVSIHHRGHHTIELSQQDDDPELEWVWGYGGMDRDEIAGG